MKQLLVTLLLISSSWAFAQNKADLQLLRNQCNQPTHPATRTSVSFVSKKLISLPLSGSLYLYQKFISTQWQTNCPHYPSCSNFAKQSIQHFGWIKGIALAADRLSRCTPLSLNNYRYYEAEMTDGYYYDLPLYYYLHR